MVEVLVVDVDVTPLVDVEVVEVEVIPEVVDVVAEVSLEVVLVEPAEKPPCPGVPVVVEVVV